MYSSAFVAVVVVIIINDRPFSFTFSNNHNPDVDRLSTHHSVPKSNKIARISCIVVKIGQTFHTDNRTSKTFSYFRLLCDATIQFLQTLKIYRIQTKIQFPWEKLSAYLC